MQIRTLEAGERDAWLDLLNGWELPDGWTGRDFFRRWIEFDPTWRDENVWVAEDAGRLVSTVQVFPRDIQVLDRAVPTGGIGSVFTREEHRRNGIAGSVLDEVLVSMRERGMELSLLFATRFDFYRGHGWECWKNQRAWLSRVGEAHRAGAETDDIAVSCFEKARDLAEAKVLHAEYSRSRSGTVIRDEALWAASFDLAGNPEEELVVGRRGGALVAYLRLTRMSGKLIATELARSEDAEPLAALIDDQLRAREQDCLAAAGQPSEELRASMLLPCFDDLPLTVALEQRGITASVVGDPENMLQCLDAEALAARLDVSLRSDETPVEFLMRVLPPERFVFWPADRF